MTNKYHPIGTWVEVAKVAGSGYLEAGKPVNRQVYQRTLETPLRGQVVGVTRLYGGRRVEGGYDDPAHLVKTHSIQVYLVKLAMRGEPIRVLPGALTVIPPDGLTLPFQRAWDAPSAHGLYGTTEAIEPAPKRAAPALG